MPRQLSINKPRANHEQLIEHASGQEGVLSCQQLHALGWNDEAIRSAVTRHQLARVTRGIYNTVTGEPSWLAFAWAAHLRYGNASYLAGNSALQLLGFGKKQLPITIAVPGGYRRMESAEFIVKRHRRRRQITLRGGLPSSRATDALLDYLKDVQSPTGARNLVADAYQKRILVIDELEATMRGIRVKHRKVVSDTLNHLKSGQTTPLEIRGVKRIIEAHSLPTGKGQATIRSNGPTQIVDYLYAEYGTVVEFDGRLGHDDAYGVFRDKNRDNRSITMGLRTLRFGMSDVNEDACGAAQQLATVLRFGGWRGFAQKCGPDCPLIA